MAPRPTPQDVTGLMRLPWQESPSLPVWMAMHGLGHLSRELQIEAMDEIRGKVRNGWDGTTAAETIATRFRRRTTA